MKDKKINKNNSNYSSIANLEIGSEEWKNAIRRNLWSTIMEMKNGNSDTETLLTLQTDYVKEIDVYMNGLSDIKDNKIMLLEEDIECVHMFLDSLGSPRGDEHGTYSIIGRIKKLVNNGS